MKHALDVVYCCFFHAFLEVMKCLIFKDFIFVLGSSHLWPFFLLTVHKSHRFDNDKKNLLFGFRFHLFRMERQFQLL